MIFNGASFPSSIFCAAAGMRVLGFTGGSHCGPDEAAALLAAGAERVFSCLTKLPALLDGSD